MPQKELKYFYIAAYRISDTECFPSKQEYANCYLVQKIMPNYGCSKKVSEHATREEAHEETERLNNVARLEQHP